MQEPDLKNLLDSTRQPGKAGHRALGRLLRLIDDNDPAFEQIDNLVKSTAFRAMRIGLTGPPGSGKSSLIASAMGFLAATSGKIGILAVDPTSPFTGGAVLGDRVRLKGPVPENVFFRSLASRGSVGGVSRAIWPASRVLDWWGADIILIETVGSGQLGVGIAEVADIVVAVLTPDAGDGIQSMKAGVMELADCFIVNKSDRPGSDLMMKELQLIKEEAITGGREVEIYMTCAVKNEGVREAIEGISAMWVRLKKNGQIEKRRLIQAKGEISKRAEAELHERVIADIGGMERYRKILEKWGNRVLMGEATVSEASRELLNIIPQ